MKSQKTLRGFDSEKRWGNSATPGFGVNSPAMMQARAKFEAERETIGETMAELDLSDAEWDAIPPSVQQRLIARVFRTRKSPTELLAEAISADPYLLTPDQWQSEANQALAESASEPTKPN